MSKLGRQQPLARIPRPSRRATDRLRARAAPLRLLAGLPAARPPRPAPAAPLSHGGVPVPARSYIYMGFGPSSWDRAKIALPAFRVYTSDHPPALRRHIEWATQAGTYGCSVRWKSIPIRTRRLPHPIYAGTTL